MKTKIMTMVAIAIGTLFATAAESNYFVAKTTAYGQLAEVLGDKATEIDSLVVEGPIDENDFFAMWSCSFYDNLTVINLEKADIKDKTIPDNTFWNQEEQYYCADAHCDVVRRKYIKLRKIIFPNDLYKIGKDAFFFVENLESLKLPSTLRILGNGAFMGCFKNSGGEVVIPEGIEEIPLACFGGCVKVKKWVLPTTLKKLSLNSFRDCTLNDFIIPEGVEIIDGAFPFSIILSDLIIPNSRTRIGDDTFQNASNPESNLIISETCELGNHVFRNYKGKTVSLPNTLTQISSEMFANSTLESLEIPPSVRSIDEKAFYMCNLKTITGGDNVEKIGPSAFYISALESIEIPNNVKIIEDWAFLDCEKLKDVTFGDNIETIGKRAFDGTVIERIEIPQHMETVGEQAFINCKNLVNITLNEGVKKIGKEAFKDASAEYIILPESLEEVETSGLYIRTLKRIYSKAMTPPSLAASVTGVDNAFGNGSPRNHIYEDASVYIPIGTMELYKNAPGWKTFKNFIETDDFTGVDEVETDNGIVVLGENGNIVIKSDRPMQYSVYNIAGNTVANGVVESTVTIPCSAGVFIVNVDGIVNKVAVK